MLHNAKQIKKKKKKLLWYSEGQGGQSPTYSASACPLGSSMEPQGSEYEDHLTQTSAPLPLASFLASQAPGEELFWGLSHGARGPFHIHVDSTAWTNGTAISRLTVCTHCMNAPAKTQLVHGPWTEPLPLGYMPGPSSDESRTSPGHVLALCSSTSSHCEQAPRLATACPTAPSPAWEETRRKGRLSSLVSSRAGMAPAFVQAPSLLPWSFSSQQQPEDEGGYLGTFACQPVWAPVLAGPLASGGALHPNFLIGKLGIQIVPASHGFERINEYNVTKPQWTGWPSVS